MWFVAGAGIHESFDDCKPATISLNAAIFTATLLASRLQDDSTVLDALEMGCSACEAQLTSHYRSLYSWSGPVLCRTTLIAHVFHSVVSVCCRAVIDASANVMLCY